MNELASKLFKTFFRYKKSFLRKKLELVKVTSKTEIFGDFRDFTRFPTLFRCKGRFGVQKLFDHKKNRKNCVNTFVHSCSTCQTYYFDLIFSVDIFQQVSNVQF